MLKRKRLAQEDDLEAVIQQMRSSRLEHKDSRLLCLPDDLLALVLSFDSIPTILETHALVCRHFHTTVKMRFRQIVPADISLTENEKFADEELLLVKRIPRALGFLVSKGARNVNSLHLVASCRTAFEESIHFLCLLNPHTLILQTTDYYTVTPWAFGGFRAGYNLHTLDLSLITDTRLLESIFVYSPNIKKLTLVLSSKQECLLTRQLLSLLPDLNSIKFACLGRGDEFLDTRTLNELVQACGPRLESISCSFSSELLQNGIHLLTSLKRLHHVDLLHKKQRDCKVDLTSLTNWTMLESVTLNFWSDDDSGAYSFLLGKAPIQELTLRSCFMKKETLMTILVNNEHTLRELNLFRCSFSDDCWSVLFDQDLPELEMLRVSGDQFLDFIQSRREEEMPRIHWPKLVKFQVWSLNTRRIQACAQLVQQMAPGWNVKRRPDAILLARH